MKPTPVTDSTPSVVLAGAGGFGRLYVERLLQEEARGRVRFVAVVDPRIDELTAALPDLPDSVARFPSLEAFYAEHRADLACISTPIATHRPLTEMALAHGSHVLLEKPAAATIQDVQAMLDAERRAERIVGVGFQWSFAPEILELKRRILAGDFGRPRRLRVCVAWPRSRAYYTRNDWAGRLRTTHGHWVLDSPAHNAHSHYLHNMLFLTGEAQESSAEPAEVSAELYRAHPIETFDTVAARIVTRSGAELLFYGTHLGDPREGEHGPRCLYEFERATIRREDRGALVFGAFEIEHDDGRRERLRSSTDIMEKVSMMIDAVRTGRPVACGLSAAASQVRCVNAMHESMPTPITLGPGHCTTVEHDGARWIVRSGLTQELEHCFGMALLPSECGLEWARAGHTIDAADYDFFPTHDPLPAERASSLVSPAPNPQRQ